MPSKTQETKVTIYTNEDGSKTTTLPVCGDELTLRSPKGRDLKAIARRSKALESDPEGTELDLTFGILSLLSDKPEDYFLELDGVDVEAAGKLLTSFRVFG